MHKLTEKNKQFLWNEICQISFEILKSALTKAPVLAYSTQNDHFILDTDASNYGIGAVCPKYKTIVKMLSPILANLLVVQRENAASQGENFWLL